MRKRCCASTGFSLIELLVVMAILGVVTALLLPALQSSREAARRSTCLSRLRQLGLAAHHFESTHHSFPVGCLECDYRLRRPRRQWSWNIFLLPHLEQEDLAAQIDPASAYSAAANRAAFGTVVPVFLCPSTVRTQRRGPTTGDRNGNGTWDPGDGLAYTDYGGLYGVSYPTPHILPQHEGVMIYERAIRPRDIHDGLSRTAMLGECTGRDERFAAEWANGQNIFDQTHNRRINESQDNELWSDHPGGVQVVYCDGHAEFLPESLDQAVLLAFLTRRGQD